MSKKPKAFLARAKSWISENQLHGPHAFLRFVMLAFVQRMNEVTDEFVFPSVSVWVRQFKVI